MRNDELRKSLRRLPTGRYNMADMEFSIREIKPEPPQEEPLTFSEYDLLDGVIMCAKEPFQDMEEAVEWLIGMNVLTSEVQS